MNIQTTVETKVATTDNKIGEVVGLSVGETESEDIQVYRAGGYRLLAALLRTMPDQALLDHLTTFAGVDNETDALALTLAELGQAAVGRSVDAVNDEFHVLFIGLGRGERVPYGSWYLTGFLMEKPLGLLRDDLALLGYERQAGTHEPEDHIAALCEVMSMLINEGVEHGTDKDIEVLQQRFFQSHIETWAERFFHDLMESPSADFYRTVGRFGLEFMKFETRYLGMTV